MRQGRQSHFAIGANSNKNKEVLILLLSPQFRLFEYSLQSLQFIQNMKSALLLILSLTLLVTIRADYFAGVVTDQKLATDTTNAINDLKNTLMAYLDCSDNSRKTAAIQLGGIFNLGGFNLFGKPRKLFSIFQAMFKKNNDRSVFTFNNPINKCSFDILGGFSRKMELYNKCTTLSQLLSKIKELLKNYNVIIGQQNKVVGNKNWVVGSKDSINGNNNWVFTSDLELNSVEDGVLIIGNYLIELVDINLIPLDPNQAIRCVTTEDSNSKFRQWWGNVPNYRKTCF